MQLASFLDGPAYQVIGREAAVNEFRAQLSDQASTFMPRAEASAESSNIREKIDALTGRIDALATRFERGEGQRTGLKDGWGYLVGAAWFIATVIAIVFALIQVKEDHMTQLVDMLERSAWTFVQTFAASVVLINSLGLGDLKIAAGAAVLSVLKNLSIAIDGARGGRSDHFPHWRRPR